jgi:DNA-binding MarR family transcriptional regulator
VKPLDVATNPALDHPAELVMETVSMVMRAIRQEMREHRPVEMSMQQFRALGVVNRHPGESLSVVATHLGLTDASASKLVDALVRTRLVKRIDALEDRRKVVLTLTKAGRAALESAREAALGRLGGVLAALDEPDRLAVIRAMNVLREALSDALPAQPEAAQ